MARELSRVFRIFVPESFVFCISTFGRPVVKHGGFYYLCRCQLCFLIDFARLRWEMRPCFLFCPEWPFLSRFPGLSVSGGISYRFCRETPLNRKFGGINVLR